MKKAEKNEEHCVCCGEVIPEGRMVCIRCERYADPIRTSDIKPKLLKRIGGDNVGTRTRLSRSSKKR